MATTSYGTPYVEAADLVSGYPSTSLTLADRVDDISFKGNGINNQTGTTYTLDILDAGKTVTLSNSSAVTVTIPTNTAEAIEIGSVIRFNNKGAGTVTIQPDGGVTLNGGNITVGQFAATAIIKLDTNTWGVINGGPGRIVQVASTAKTDTFTTTSSSFVDVTGLTVQITPTRSTNKILVMLHLMGSFYKVGSNGAYIRLYRDSTAIGIADTAGSRERVSTMPVFFNDAVLTQGSAIFLDSPASTSTLTYKPQIRTDASTIYVNRSITDSDSPNNPRGFSSITVMEVTA